MVQGKVRAAACVEPARFPAFSTAAASRPQQVMLDRNELLHNVEQEAFFSSILDVTFNGEHLQAIVKDLQVHPARRAVVHLDLQRILANEKIRMTVPLHFLNEASAKGVKEGGGVVQHLMTEVQINCLPRDLPEFLTLDIIELELNKNLHLSDIKLPDGVEITDLAGGVENNRPVVSIHMVKEEVEAPVEGAGIAAAAAAPAEGAVAAAEAAPAGGKPGAAPAKAAAAPAKEAKGKEKK